MKERKNKMDVRFESRGSILKNKIKENNNNKMDVGFETPTSVEKVHLIIITPYDLLIWVYVYNIIIYDLGKGAKVDVNTYPYP